MYRITGSEFVPGVACCGLCCGLGVRAGMLMTSSWKGGGWLYAFFGEPTAGESGSW